MKDMVNKSLVKIKYAFAPAVTAFIVANLFFMNEVHPPYSFSSEKLLKILAMCELLLIAFISCNMIKLIKKQAKQSCISRLENTDFPGGGLILDKLSEGIIIIDSRGRIKTINQKLCALLGIEESRLLGKSLYNVLSECEGKSENKALTARIIETLETHMEYKQQEQLYLRDKEIIYFELSTSLLRNESGSIAGVLAVIKDLTQNKKIEQKLLGIEKLASAGQMAAELAHEIKNPICSVKGLIQVMGKKHQLGESKYYDTIMSELDRIALLLQDFLSLTQTNPSYNKIWISEIVEDILPLAESQALCKDISISLDIQKEIPKINCDKENIRKVFINIVQNAIDALQNNGKINISVWYDEINEKVKLEFKDNGIGIKPEYLDKIFEPFFTTKSNGSGLGLAISHKIIENHSGRIYAFNNLEGGATFVVELPIAN